MRRPIFARSANYIYGDVARWLDDRHMEHIRGAPYHPMTQGKIERWHQILKNRILLENYYLPCDLETQMPNRRAPMPR